MQSDLFTTQKNSILDGLNPEQKKAVTYKTGPLLIIAGAGTGKTTVVTKRIAYLIEQKLAKPSEILALTFTEKAAAEMEERIDQLVPYGFTDMWISTFHAFGDRLLRDHSIDLGLPANFKVLTGTEQAIFMRENIYAFDLKHYRPIANPLSHIEAFLNHFSRLKDELISPENYKKHVSSWQLAVSNNEEKLDLEKYEELANAYGRYNDLMIQAGNLDFGDQLYLTYQLLKNNPKVLKQCQEKFKFILVDEYQDTNFAQNEIVKLLSNKYNNITVVGDDDQSIYRFRGASISNILDFKNNYKNLTQIVLNKNYRSTQEILDASYKLIQNNNPDRLEIQNKINKRLISPKHGAMPELLHCDTLSCEADNVVRKIAELKKENNFSYRDFAILVRANSHAEPFIQSLNLAGVPFVFSGASGLFAQKEVKMLIAFLKCLAYTDDNLAFYQLATSELYNIGHDVLSEYYTLAKRSNRSIIWVIKNNMVVIPVNSTLRSSDLVAQTRRAKAGILDPRVEPEDDTTKGQNEGLEDKTKIFELVEDLEKYSNKKNEPAGEVLYQYLTEKNYLKNLLKNLSVENELKISNIAKFFDRIGEFNHSSENKDILSFLRNLELILEVGDEASSANIDPEIDAVNILTAHASKGLEWPVVFIANCVADRFPSRRKKEQLPIPDGLIKERLPEGDFHTEEERRLFYVAATRAKQYLFLSAADDYGGKRTKKLSPFVMELLDQPNPDKLKHKLSVIEKIERFKKIENKPIALPQKFKGEIIRLSRQQIDDYFSCPKKFYFAHIIKIPLLENHYLMYGTAIHAALDHYFRRKIDKVKTSLEQLIADYENAFHSAGFISREQEDLREKAGIETLTNFYNEDQKSGNIPSEVEEVFEFTEKNVKINGRYDLVYGDKKAPEICDFKTSNVKDQKDANRRIKESTQMMIYALAWFEKYEIIPKTTLHFIESGLKGEIIFKKSDLDKTKEMVFSVADGIRENKMEAKPEKRQCSLCPYSDICPDSL